MNISERLIAQQQEKDVLFLFLNGDNWNYYGIFELNKMLLERRFPYKVDRSAKESHLAPIEPEHIDIMINIDQLGCSNLDTYVVHSHPHAFLDKLK